MACIKSLPPLNIVVVIQNRETPNERNDVAEIQNARNDSENVHDHSVQADIQQNIDNLLLKFNIETQDVHNILCIIEKHMQEHMNTISSDTYQKCMMTFKHLRTYKGLYNITETHALALVWSRLCELLSIEDAIHLLMLGLSENTTLTESGQIVQLCDTGRFSRIINILSGVDQTHFVRPSWSIKQEWNNLVPHLKQKWFLDQNIEQDKYDNNELENQDITQHALKKYIYEQIKQRHMYMDDEILKNYLHDYLENV
jgi:hypothetical protein